MKIQFLFFTLSFLFLSLPKTQAQQNFTIGERHEFHSKILDEKRAYQVYLPPSYFFKPNRKYPVIYLMDGDYNFHYDSGLIEYMSTVGEKIPEMILVGISDKGSKKYRNYCSPTLPDGEGKANEFMDFIDGELRPHIDEKFRTSSYEILIGHSMGGLFVTNYFLERPESFESYIAIDPSLWANEYEISTRADSTLKKMGNLNSNLFISLAETKQMGIFQFIGVLDKYFPRREKWKFQHLENENHGSAHLPSIQKGLKWIFKDWNLSGDEVLEMESSGEIVEHYLEFEKGLDTSFPIPPYFLGNSMYHYYYSEKQEELELLGKEIKEKLPVSWEDFQLTTATLLIENEKVDEAEKIYTELIAANKMSYQSYAGLSKIYAKKELWDKALSNCQKAIEIAKKGKARQWMLNELNSNLEEIKNK